MSVFYAYEQVFDNHPSGLSLFQKRITRSHLEAFVEARLDQPPETLEEPQNSSIWPLISHHHFNPHSLFNSTPRRAISERVLSALVAYDGLVISDPTLEVVQLWEAGDPEEALRRLQSVTGKLAEVEPLIDSDKLRFEMSRPAFTDEARAAVLDAFGIEHDFGVFINFSQSSDALDGLSSQTQRAYARDAADLFHRFGLPVSHEWGYEQAALGVANVGRALIHLSWQLAICSDYKSANLALSSPIEEQLLANLLDAFRSDDTAFLTAPHFARVMAGDMPHIDVLDLTIPDALAIRKDDAFEGFRDALHDALGELELELRTGATEVAAKRAFEGRMGEESRRLASTIKGASFKDRLGDGVAPTAVGFVSDIVLNRHWEPEGIATAAAVGVGVGVGAILYEWLRGRTKPGVDVAIRYSAILSNPRALR